MAGSRHLTADLYSEGDLNRPEVLEGGRCGTYNDKAHRPIRNSFPAKRLRIRRFMLNPRGFPETRISLLRSLRGGAGRVGWREFFDLYAPAVYRVARVRGLSESDADDVVQKVMLSISNHIDAFEYERDRGRFRDWVRRIAENKIRDDFRQSKIASPVQTLPAEHPDSTPSIEALWEEQWRLQDMMHCLDLVASNVSPTRIQAFRLYVLGGLSAQEVADQLDVTVGYVYTARCQLLKMLRVHLDRLDRTS